MRCSREIIERTQPCEREMNMGSEVVPLAPGFGRALDIAENGGRGSRAVGGGQEREYLLLLALQALQLAHTFGRNENGAGAQHQALQREDHRRAGEGGGLLARKRTFTRLFVQHVSSPFVRCSARSRRDLRAECAPASDGVSRRLKGDRSG
jgi:hypothetical protein